MMGLMKITIKLIGEKLIYDWISLFCGKYLEEQQKPVKKEG